MRGRLHSNLIEPFLAVIVPAYNEEPRIIPTLQRLDEYFSEQAYTWSVTVVSDGSTDGTNDLVAEFVASHPRFFFKAYEPNRGKGYAVRTGMLEAQGERLLFADADMATPIEEVEKLLAAMDDGAQVAIGSRPLRESNLVIRQPFYREWLGRMFNKVVQALAVKGIQDTQCGFKLFSGEAAQKVFRRCRLDGFSFDFEALLVARDLGYKIAEVPIRWSHQEGSKVVLMRDGPRMLRDLVALRIQGRKARLKNRAN
jgi:dolichyl-phosphate beta-glucosyltransferase